MKHIQGLSIRKPAPTYMRRPLREAVKEVLGNKNSAVIGDDLAAALRDAGYDIYRPDESIVRAFDGTLVESGWCKAHQYPAERYSDGGIACWWESIVEASGYHEPDDFMPCRLVPVGGDR